MPEIEYGVDDQPEAAVVQPVSESPTPHGLKSTCKYGIPGLRHIACAGRRFILKGDHGIALVIQAGIAVSKQGKCTVPGYIHLLHLLRTCRQRREAIRSYYLIVVVGDVQLHGPAETSSPDHESCQRGLDALVLQRAQVADDAG